MNNNIQALNKSAVKQAADFLILTNGNTTTLDVKFFLRNQGYRAFQKEISRYMELISQEQGWEFVHNGNFKIYSYTGSSSSVFGGNLPGFSFN